MIPVDVFYTEEFEDWFTSLRETQQDEVIVVVRMLESAGVMLGFPASSALKGSRLPLRELRPKQGRSPLRVVYAFDPDRDAVLLVGGNKGTEKRFYERIISAAEKIWVKYLAERESVARWEREPKR